MRPGVNVTVRDNAPPSTVPTDVGTGFMVGITEAGPTLPTVSDLVQNMDEFKAKYAPTGRSYIAAMTMYDAAETFFAEGGNRLYVGRVFGPLATPASVTLKDAAAANCLIVTARGVGDYGNGIDIVVRTSAEDPNIAVNSFRIRLVRESDNVVLDESYDLADVSAAIAWSFNNSYISLAGSTSVLDPAPGTFDLVTGTNDIGGITNAQWQAGVDSLSYTLGPGILFAPGVTTGAIYNILAEAARRDLRVAFLDAPNTPTELVLTTAVKAIVDSTLARARFVGFFAPWLVVPGITSTTVRTVPPSPAVAGRFAKNMADGLSANEPAAGELGTLRTVLDLTQSYTDAVRQRLNDNGINIIRDIYGVRKVYGWRTTADPVNDQRWLLLNNSIMHRQIVAECNLIGESFIFRQIDGQGRLIAQFGASLEGNVFMPLFLEGSLFGSRAGEAYKVDVGPSINTIATQANNELRAVCSVRMSPFSEEVVIEIVKYLVTEEIPA